MTLLVRRVRGAGLGAHALALGLLLAVLVPLLDNGALVSADEGAVLSQMEIRATTGEWGLPNPAPTVDRDGRFFGIDISDTDGDRFFPYAKHAAYPAAAQPLFDLGTRTGLGGQRLVIALSALGTWCAAVFAALLARHLGRSTRLDLATLWVVGVASPLFFDSFWVIAHSIGAAFATGAVLSAVRLVESRSWRWLAPLALGVLGATLFRSEGMLFGLALASAFGLVTLLDRSPRWLLPGAAAGAVALGGWWVDSRVYSAIVGIPIEPFQIHNQGGTWLGERAAGAWASVLRPQLLDATTAGALFLAVALLVTVGALYVRHRPDEVHLVRGVSAVVAVAALGALALPKAPVPGLLIAFPLLPAGIALLRRDQLRSTPARLVVTTTALFALAILATQYPVGGSMEWGGRFFHLALPSIVPLLLVAVIAAGARLDRVTARWAGGSLVVVTLVLGVFAVGSIVRIRSMTGDIVDGIGELSSRTAEALTPEGPVVVSNMEAVGRLAWDQAVDGRFLRVTERRDLAVVARRLAASGVEDLVFAAPYHYSDVDRLVGYTVVETRTVGQWKLSRMTYAGPVERPA